MKVIFNSMKGTSRISAKMNLQQKNVPDKFEAAVREILKLFQKTNEIGRLEKQGMKLRHHFEPVFSISF